MTTGRRREFSAKTRDRSGHGGSQGHGGSRRSSLIRGALRRRRGLATFAVLLGSNVLPAVSLFHVLLEIALALGGISTWIKHAVVGRWVVRMAVVDMAITLFLGGPADVVVLAVLHRTLPRTRVSLFVLGEVARTLEDFVAVAALLVDVHGRFVLFPPRHGALHVVFCFIAVDLDQRVLHDGRVLSCLIDDGGERQRTGIKRREHDGRESLVRDPIEVEVLEKSGGRFHATRRLEIVSRPKPGKGHTWGGSCRYCSCC